VGVGAILFFMGGHGWDIVVHGWGVGAILLFMGGHGL
jgi:hypothetical protein